jgi:hypothetical protein
MRPLTSNVYDRKSSFGRRNLLKLSAAAAVATTIAGCTETTETHREWGNINEVVLEGYTDGWKGIRPDAIADEVNPTLVFYESQEYEITMRNGDGEAHSLEIRNGSGVVDEGYQTEIIEEEGRTRTLTVRASLGTSEYVCPVHSQRMHGEIDVRPENDNDVYNEDV